MPLTRWTNGLAAAALLAAVAGAARANDTERAAKGHRYAEPTADTARESRILYTEDGGLFVAFPDGSDAQRVLPRTATCVAASWSPDGTRIAFAGSVEASPGIFVVDADGENLVQLAPTRSRFATRPAWSPAALPDGQHRIVFDDTVDDTEENRDLWVVRPDGRGLRNLTHTPGVSEWYPTWSPEADRIAFVSQERRDLRVRRGRRSWGCRVAWETVERSVQDVMVGTLADDDDGLVLRDVENVTSVRKGKLAFDESKGESHRFAYLEWSRAGERLAAVVSCAPDRLQSDVWLIDLERPAAARNLTRSDASETCLSWSPDDTHVVFFRETADTATTGIYRARADGRGKVELLRTAEDRRSVDWQRRPAARPQAATRRPAVPETIDNAAR